MSEVAEPFSEPLKVLAAPGCTLALVTAFDWMPAAAMALNDGSALAPLLVSGIPVVPGATLVKPVKPGPFPTGTAWFDNGAFCAKSGAESTAARTATRRACT